MYYNLQDIRNALENTLSWELEVDLSREHEEARPQVGTDLVGKVKSVKRIIFMRHLGDSNSQSLPPESNALPLGQGVYYLLINLVCQSILKRRREPYVMYIHTYILSYSTNELSRASFLCLS